jgi:PhnB protein
MPKTSLAQILDQAIQAALASSGLDARRTPAGADPELAPLLHLAAELQDLPREGFKEQLRIALERKITMTGLTESVAVRQTATARLRIRNASAAIEFYRNAFGAKEIMRFVVQGKIAYGEIEIGNSIISVGEEAPEYGFPGPEELGGSPVAMQLYVDDADAAVRQAVAAGARLVTPVKDQFYGDRSGMVADPFGYRWSIASRKEELSVEEMHRRFEALGVPPAEEATPMPAGYHALVAQDGPGLVEFVKGTFGAEETFRAVGSAGGLHAELKLGDSQLMIGGGGTGLAWRGESNPAALHVYVEDTDEVYRRALEAGCTSLQAPADQFYGERSGSVTDPFGNNWYIATAKGDRHVAAGMRTVTPCLHPVRAEPVIAFLKRALGAEEVEKHASPEGVIQHAKVRIGDSMLEMGEAHGHYRPMQSMFYVYVSNVDATFLRAMNAGAALITEPADQSYGDRVAAVKDPFGNQWYMATHGAGAK